MEAFTLHTLVSELTSLLIGHRLGKVVQFGVTDLALDLRLRDGRWLLVSTDPKRLALHLTSKSIRQFETEARTDTPFVALCKKYLSGARIVAIEGLGYDRVVRVSFVTEDESGQEIARDLVIQLIGRSANVLVLEDNQILASLRERQDGNDERYEDPPPPADKIDPFYCSAEKLNELIAISENDFAIAARVHLIGFGPQFAAEFAARAEPATSDAALHKLLEEVFTQAPTPVVYSSAPLAEMQQAIGCEPFTLTFAPLAMKHLQHLHATPFASVNQAADACFTLLDERRSFLTQRQQAESQFNTRLKKLQSLHKNLTREQAGFAKAETHQRYGELLLANLHQAEKIEQDFRVVDFYDPEQQTMAIPAANKATAQEAAEHYFKLARKARHGMQTIQARLPGVETEITNLKSQMEALREITRLSQLQESLANGELPRPTAKAEKAVTSHKKTKEQKISGVRRYRSSDGYEILVGRTSRDNDQLTMRVAKSFDIWLHAADYPGSHVVLRNPQRTPVPNRAILEAAQLAAKFSQANNDSGAKVAVNYCEKKFVTKPKGFGPGQVRLSAFKTVLIEPAEAGERMF